MPRRKVVHHDPISITSAPVHSVRWILIGLVVLLAAGFGIVSAGKLFIREATQELILPAATDAVGEKPAVGYGAPSFDLQTLGVGRKKLEDFRGTPIVLLFWTSWNRDALSMLRALDAVATEYHGNSLQFIAINSQEEPAFVKSFVGRGGYSLGVLMDKDGAVGTLYEAHVLPATFLIDSHGIVQEKITGTMSESALVDKISSVLGVSMVQ
mgnify:CR=1 FL=1